MNYPSLGESLGAGKLTASALLRHDALLGDAENMEQEFYSSLNLNSYFICSWKIFWIESIFCWTDLQCEFFVEKMITY